MTIEEDGAGGFAARWSRLKIDARQKNIPEEAANQPVVNAEAAPVSPVAGAEEAEVDLSDLPAIEAIDSNTDIAPWLAKKVPDGWRLAALRKVWSSDPAISQFIGPSDYAWDWNVPDGVPGFGPLRALDNVAKLVAQAIGSAEPSQESAVKKGAESVPDQTVSSQSIPAAETVATKEDVGQHQPEDATEFAASPAKQRGGGALPS